MAFTERELEISNKSYTNKDFASIYEELLTYAEKISDRFSPTTSVETDPFIVLLKLAAFVADKINYNIDKNILERAISSCTQEESMRDLTEALGYAMHYYRAAQTSVFLNYRFPEELLAPISVPKYSIIESTSKIPYVTLNDAEINKEQNSSGEIVVMQGKLQTLTILGSPTIQLENLTSNNRLYFPELMVAENGVFISDAVNNEWKKVDNLNTQVYGSPCYKFSFDSKRNLPYIEFPDWIADIIGSGLGVDYMVTQGETGNVAAKELVSIKKRSVEDDIDNANIRVVNLSAAASGANPETIDQSFNGFKKIVGTFDTLVACRDYANAIYNLLKGTGTPYVSNVQVADRRTDINYACDVITYAGGVGPVNEPMPIKVGAVGAREDCMTPFDLAVYPLTPITNTTYSAINSNTDGYNNSFKVLEQSKINDITTQLEIDDNIHKSLCHTYKELDAQDIASIQIYYELTATISTIAKVNILEQTDIIANIYSAIAKEFNARKLNFGYEISFNDLVSVMGNADKRIKYVNLQEPIQVPKIIRKDNVVCDIDDGAEGAEKFKFIVAKNVLAGRASLFEYDLDFTYDYSYSHISKTADIKKITTSCNFDELDPNVPYTLLTNEVIQFLAPNLITEKIYSTGIYYYLKLNLPAIKIDANVDRQLASGEELLFYYLKDGAWLVDYYPAGTIINSKEILYTTEQRLITQPSPDKRYTKDGTTYSLFGLVAGEQVEIKKINSEELKSQKKCYWITNETDNLIKWEADNSYVLKENEYFFYSDINLTSLYAFGSGTKLNRHADMSGLGWEWTCSKDINIDDITLEGLYALNDAFMLKSFNDTHKLTITENEIRTLTAGDQIKSSASLTINDNDFTTIGAVEIQYQYVGESSFSSLPDRSSITDGNWYCRSLLDINCGPDLEQTIEGNQKIYYTTESDRDIIEASDPCLEAGDVLKFNLLIQRGGGKNIDLGYVTIINQEQKIYPTLLTVTKAADCQLKQLSNGMYGPEFSVGENTAKFYASELASKSCYILVYVENIGEGASPTLVSNAGDTITLSEGVNIKQLPAAAYWILTRTADTQSFALSPIKYVIGINPLLGLPVAVDLANFISYLETSFIEQYPKFYSLADLDPSKEIELSTKYKLNSAQAFYDSNNVVNKWVLPKIDFTESAGKITIARNSIK